MKPSRLLHILAYSVELASAAGVLGAWAFGLCFAAGGAPPVMEWSYLAGVLLLVVLSIPGGAVIGVIVLLPFLQLAARAAGARAVHA